MSKIKMLNLAITLYGTFKTGQVVDIPDDMAKTWVKTGLAESVLTTNNSGSGEQIEGCQPGSFFCHACLLDKPSPEASPDPRYCQGCYDFLLKEASMLDGRKPTWVPKDSQAITRTPPEPSCKPIGVGHNNSGTRIGSGIMSTVESKKDAGKRGPKQKALPQELIKQWAGEGMGSKAIASRLKSELGIKVSYKTVQRALSSKITPF